MKQQYTPQERINCPDCGKAFNISIEIDEDQVITLDDRVIFPGVWPARLQCPAGHGVGAAVSDPEMCLHGGQVSGLIGGIITPLGGRGTTGEQD